jgi:hypothetical protein
MPAKFGASFSARKNLVRCRRYDFPPADSQPDWPKTTNLA